MYVCIDAMERGIQVFCVKRILACFVAFVGVLFMAVGGANAAAVANFYDENGTELEYTLGTDSEVTSTYCLKNSSDGKYFSCDGKCSDGGTRVVANGSSFISGVDGKTYVCTINGWMECLGYDGSMNTLDVYMYKKEVGYKKVTLRSGADISVPATFCRDPAFYLYNFGGVDVFTNYSSLFTFDGRYIACTAGSKLVNGYCVGCGSLTGGIYNNEEWHDLEECRPDCFAGLTYSVNHGACGLWDAVYDMCNYNPICCEDKDNDYRSCPDGALCDDDGWIYCPAGTFVSYVEDDCNTGVTCRSCPGNENGIMAMAEAYYRFSSDEGLVGCDGNRYGMIQNDLNTDCQYTDISTTDYSACVVSQGSDDSGKYEYRYNDNLRNWYTCPYE